MILDRPRLLARLAAGATVVTPNRRLARDLKRAFDFFRQSAGERVWRSADVLPWEAWLARSYQELPPANDTPRLLSALQERTLWQQVIAESAAAEAPQVRAEALAAGAGAAWALLHEYSQLAEVERAAASDEQRAFADWASEYARRLRRLGAISAAQLPALLATRLPAAAAAPLVIADVEPPTPAAARLLAALAAAGTSVETAPCQDEPIRADACRVQCTDLAEQWRLAAAWARARLQADREARIGIVVPDLGAQRLPLIAALTDALAPALRVWPQPQAARPFNVSLGQSLAQTALVSCALALLDLADGELEIAGIGGLLRSPFIAGGAAGEPEWERRARLDLALREAGAWQLSLEALRRAAIGADAPGGRGSDSAALFADALTRIAHRRSSVPRRQPMSAWIAHCHGVLADAGFPGSRTLDSVEHQTHERWRALLAEVAALDGVLGQIGFGEARARLRRAAAETLFQPEGVDAPVQVLGVLESAQLEFDHLWLASLSDERWPPPPQPDPWLPVALQRRWQLPQASAELSLRQARRRLSNWLAAARTVVASHAELEADRPQTPSPLIAALPLRAATALAPASEALARQLANHRPLAAQVDTLAPPLAPEQAQALRGGTRVVTDQSACAFRAFATHRLHAQPLPQPRPGLDPMLRGGLLHATLEAFWRDLGSQAALRALGDGALHARLSACADAALDELARSRAELRGPRLRDLERERLLRAVHAWLQIEDQRPPFSVLTVEAQGRIALGGLALQIRPDRVDRLDDGSLAIIDYKTGRVAIGDWLEARPQQPQLPLYAVAFDSGQLACGRQRVGAVAFALLRPGQYELRALAAAERLLPGARVVGAQETLIAQPGWDGLLADWSAALVALARSFVGGEAAVAPKSLVTSCEHCALPPLCRIGERIDLATRLGSETQQAPDGEGADD